jgi:hypothetical protein
MITVEKAYLKKDFFDKMNAVFRYVRFKPLTNHTPCVMLSPSVFQAMMASLHLETPFNYYKLLQTDGEVAGNDWEFRRQKGVIRSEFQCPSAETLKTLAEEAVTVLSISIRTFERLEAVDNHYKLVYLYGRILGLHLFLKKGIIAAPYCEQIIDCYAKHFPEQREYLGGFKTAFMEKDIKQIGQISSKELFKHYYPFLKNVLTAMNHDLSAK